MAKKINKKKEITINDLALMINGLTVKVDDLATTVDGLTVKVDDLATTVDGLTVKVDDLEMTVEELARMTQRGFENTATKTDVTRIDIRLDHIENLLIRAHENRIEILEDKMRQVQTTLGQR
ncbi:MAG: hypothetical protein HYT28_02320 [Parcubacteria group bacterium]|nr:hypothetical protein [Parcubacteria group bacterium]